MVMDLQTTTIAEPEQYPERTVASNLQPSVNGVKPRNLLGLKLQINALPIEETSDVIWTLDSSEESSPSSSMSPDKCLRSDDSGFSSDDNMQLHIESGNKLSRSKSLRSALRTPTLAHSESRKTVRFADSLGLDLVHKTYYEADDDCSDEFEDTDAPYSSFFSTATTKRCPKTVGLTLAKIPERTDAEICHLTRTQCVCLQSVKVVDTNITGIIDVLNIACEKQVYVRYTTDNWVTHAEAVARYTGAIGKDGAVDAFTFFVALPTDLPIGAVCQFCIRYVVNGTVYWDNSEGSNYTIEAVEKVVATEKLERNDAKKPPKPPVRKFGMQERTVYDFDETNFLPFSMRSAVRNNQWKRHYAMDKDYFHKC